MKTLLLLPVFCALFKMASCGPEACSLPLEDTCVGLHYAARRGEGMYYDIECVKTGGEGCGNPRDPSDMLHHGCKTCMIGIDCPDCVAKYHNIGTATDTDADSSPNTSAQPAEASEPAAETTGEAHEEDETDPVLDEGISDYSCQSVGHDQCVADASAPHEARGVGMYSSSDCAGGEGDPPTDLWGDFLGLEEVDTFKSQEQEEGLSCDAESPTCKLCVFDEYLYADACEGGPDGRHCGTVYLEPCPACVTQEFYRKLGHVPMEELPGWDDDFGSLDPATSVGAEQDIVAGVVGTEAACALPSAFPCVKLLSKRDLEFGLMVVYDDTCQYGEPGCHAYQQNCRMCVADASKSDPHSSYKACPPCGLQSYNAYIVPSEPATEDQILQEPDEFEQERHSLHGLPEVDWHVLVFMALIACVIVVAGVGAGYLVFERIRNEQPYQAVVRDSDHAVPDFNDDDDLLEAEAQDTQLETSDI